MKCQKVIPLLVVVAGLLAYHDSFTGPFIFDDAPSIQENPTIRHLWPIWDALSPPHKGAITVEGRPIVNLSLAINYALGGYEVWGYHALNLAIHILAGLTLLGVVRRTLLQPRLRERLGAAANGLALATAVIWIVHPVQTESVVYIVQRAESMMGLFYLLTLYCFIRGAGSDSPNIWYTLSVASCLLGMASKEVMISAPLIVLLYDRTFLSGSFAGAWRRRRRLHLALAATWILLGRLVVSTGNYGGAAGLGTGVAWEAYALTQFQAIAHYLRLSVWPHPLVFDYGTSLANNVGEVVPCALPVAAVLVGTLIALCRWPAVGFLGACFFAILAPTSSVMPVVTQTMAEHRMYLPLAAVIAVVVVGGFVLGERLLSKQRGGVLAWLAGGSVVLLLTTLTIQRNQNYNSEFAIWQDTVAKCPNNSRAHYNLGDILRQKGRMQEAMEHWEQALRIKPNYTEAHNNLGLALAQVGKVHDAIGHYEQALRSKPDNAEAHNNLGLALAQTGKREEAIGQYEQALQIKPDFAVAHNNLGNALLQTGKLRDAIWHYEQALRIDPNLADVHINLGNALLQTGKIQDAIGHYEQALRLKPDYAEAHYHLGVALEQTGKVKQAIGHYEQALRIKPDHPGAQNNLAWLLATLAPTEGGDPVRAVTLAEWACELTNNRVAAYLDTLAAAYAAAGRFNDAIATAGKAIALARSAGQPQVAREIEAHLQLYRAGRPYRQLRTPVRSQSIDVASPHSP